MINPEELRAGPQEPKKPLPVLTEEKVREALVTNIAVAVAYTHQIRGLSESIWDAKNENILFEMRADEKLLIVSNPKETVGQFDRDQLQKVVFEVMIAHGLNLDISKPQYSFGGFDDQGVSRYRDGTSRQFLNYPSQTITGLTFQRWLDFYTETGTPIYVAWSVIGQKRPFREHFKGLLSKPFGPTRVEI